MSVKNQYRLPVTDDVIWRWNETDVSELSLIVNTLTSGSPSIAYLASSTITQKPAIEISNPAASGSGDTVGAVWAIDPTAFRKPFPSTNRFRLELNGIRHGNNLLRMGVVLLTDTTDQGMGIRLPDSGIAVSTSRWSGGTYTGSIGGASSGEVASTGLQAVSGARAGSRLRFDVSWVVATPMTVNITGWSWGESNALNTPNFCRVIHTDFTLPAAFDNWSPLTVGLFFQGNVGASAAEFADIVLRQSPLDAPLT